MPTHIYLETKSASIDESARIITTLMILIAITPMFAVSPFTVLYIYLIIVRLNQIMKKKAKDTTNHHRQKYYKS